MQGDRLHAATAVLGLGVRIVVGVRVDVVGVGATLRVLDELDPGDADVVCGQEGLPGRNERVLESVERSETCRLARPPGTRARLLDLAGIGGAKLETLRRIDPDGVEQLSANELDARDEGRGASM